MSLADEVMAVRSSVAISDGIHLACVQVRGDAHELLDRVSPRQLFVRTGQMLHTLFLDDAAKPIADVYLCAGDDDFFVIAEGMRGHEICEYLLRHAHGLQVALHDLAATHTVICVDGPYAWEAVAEITSPDVIGVPYLGFFSEPSFICFRAGKTGEYGYDLVVENAHVDALRARLLGLALETRLVSRDAIDLCMLEAGFFNVREEAREGLTPIELQLQWRVTRGRTYPGSAALADRHARERVAMIAAPSTLQRDAVIQLANKCVGRVLHTAWSYTRGEQIGLALLDASVSHAGLRGFSCDGVAVRTISSPAVNNRSLYVDPQRHTWATRADAKYPPLTRAIG